MNLVELNEKVRNINFPDPSGFMCLEGVPRAYMEIPYFDPHGMLMHVRLVYRVFGLQAVGPYEGMEAILCDAMWLEMLSLRERFVKRCGADAEPLLFWRRHFELTIEGKGKLKTGRISVRLVIPGLVDEDYNLVSLAYEGRPFYCISEKLA